MTRRAGGEAFKGIKELIWACHKRHEVLMDLSPPPEQIHSFQSFPTCGKGLSLGLNAWGNGMEMYTHSWESYTFRGMQRRARASQISISWDLSLWITQMQCLHHHPFHKETSKGPTGLRELLFLTHLRMDLCSLCRNNLGI